MVESLAHETAHALLFGLPLGADLTTNDPGERYALPLRLDPRPIEGIVHATYVLARMIYALDQISGSVRLGADERALVEQKIEPSLQSYAADCRRSTRTPASRTREPPSSMPAGGHGAAIHARPSANHR